MCLVSLPTSLDNILIVTAWIPKFPKCIVTHTLEMSTDQDWIRTEANFGRIRTGSDCSFFQNWRTGLDRTEKIFIVLM